MPERGTRDRQTSMSGGSGDRLQEAASNVVDRTTETVGSKIEDQAGTQMRRAGDMLGSVAQAVRQSGDQLREQQPQVASVADTAASQLEKAAGYVRESNPQDILREVEHFARRQPAVFVGGALLIGAVAARLLKASPQAGSGMQAGYGGTSFSSSRGGATADGTGSPYGTVSPYGSTGSGTSQDLVGVMGDGGL